MVLAITRDVPSTLARGLRTHVDSLSIDLELAIHQHEQYRSALESCGCEVVRLAAVDSFPDSVFVEDAALVIENTAVLTRSGAMARRGEETLVEPALPDHIERARIEDPGTLDGGDVLVAGAQVFVGVSTRTNDAGIEQLRQILSPMGLEVIAIPVARCLHLKSAVSTIGEKRVLLNPDAIESEGMKGLEQIPVPQEEPGAANVLKIGNKVICSGAFPLTAELLSNIGLEPIPIDNSEMLKAEAGVTCSSIIIGGQR